MKLFPNKGWSILHFSIFTFLFPLLMSLTLTNWQQLDGSSFLYELMWEIKFLSFSFLFVILIFILSQIWHIRSLLFLKRLSLFIFFDLVFIAATCKYVFNINMSLDLLLYGFLNISFLLGDGVLLVQRLPILSLLIFTLFSLFSLSGPRIIKLFFFLQKKSLKGFSLKIGYLKKTNLTLFVLALVINISLNAINSQHKSKINLAQLKNDIIKIKNKKNTNISKTVISALPSNSNVVIFLLESVKTGFIQLKDLEFFKDAGSVIDINQFYVPTSHSSNSIASLLCGCYSNDLNFFRSNKFKEKQSLPKLLNSKGYQSSYIYSGPGEYEGLGKIIANSGMNIVDSKNLLKLMPTKKFKNYYWGLDDISLFEYSKRFLKKGNRHQKNKPFFVIYGFSNSHSPYYTPHLTKSQRKKLNYLQRYKESIKYSISVINKIIIHFKQQKLYKDTLFIVMSDHGESFGDQGYWRHNFSLYNAETQVPFMMSHPSFRKVRYNKRPRVATILDVFPTIASLLGFDIPLPVTGQSFNNTNYKLNLRLNSWTNKSNYGFLLDKYKFNIFAHKKKLLISNLFENNITKFKLDQQSQSLIDILKN